MKKLLIAAFIALVASPNLWAQQAESYVASRRVAQQYAYGYGQVPGAHVAVGNSATGNQTVTVCPAIRALPDGRVINLFQSSILNPVTFDLGTSASETVTPTAVSIVSPGGLTVEADQNCAAITASFSFTHAPSQFTGQVRSGSVGLQEAINDAAPTGGLVTIDNSWGGTNAQLAAAIPFQNVSIEDVRGGVAQFWNLVGASAAIATPTTLVNATAGFGVNGANFTSGFYTGSNTYITCIAYVDVMGQEGPCSATFTIATNGSATTDQIGYTAPAASAGAVGYTIYITLSGGPYTNAYKVPLVTQPTVVGAYPVANGVCTLTKIETTTPACAVTNATYNQTGSGAVVSALTVNTSPIEPQSGIVSTTSVYVPNPGGRATYTYSPGSHIAVSGVPSPSLVFATAGSAASTVPTVLGTVNIPPGLMNYVGRTIEVCGKWDTASGDTSTIINIQFQWDAVGQNTAGKGVQIGNLGLTPATAVATAVESTFCEDFETTAVGATATGGSIQTVGGYIATAGVTTAAAGQGAGTDPTVATTASLNLAEDARINVIHLHTTSSGGLTPVLQSLTFKVLN